MWFILPHCVMLELSLCGLLSDSCFISYPELGARCGLCIFVCGCVWGKYPGCHPSCACPFFFQHMENNNHMFLKLLPYPLSFKVINIGGYNLPHIATFEPQKRHVQFSTQRPSYTPHTITLSQNPHNLHVQDSHNHMVLKLPSAPCACANCGEQGFSLHRWMIHLSNLYCHTFPEFEERFVCTSQPRICALPMPGHRVKVDGEHRLLLAELLELCFPVWHKAHTTAATARQPLLMLSIIPSISSCLGKGGIFPLIQTPCRRMGERHVLHPVLTCWKPSPASGPSVPRSVWSRRF